MVENLQLFYRWRRVALFAGMLICLCAGICYTWSVFQKPFMDLFGWSTKATSLTYTLHTVSSTILPVFVGPLQAKIRIRYYLLIGMAFYAMGLILTSFTFALPFLYMTFGFLTGIGAGMIYTCLMAYSVRIFPDKKGLASGLMTGSFGAGAILWAPAATAFSELFGFLKAFAALGVLLFGIMLIFVWFIRDVPKDINIPQKMSHRNNLTSPDLNWKQMLRTKRFYTLVVILAFGTGSGLMIMGHASPMIQSIANLTPEKAALTVGFLAIANTCGRLLWGTLSDRLGRFHVLFILFAGMATLSGLLTFAAGSAWVALLLLACTCYGGFTSILSPIAADVFGTKYLNVNYNFFFMAYGIGGILGPQLAAICVDSGFGYNPAFLVMTLLLLIGAGVTFCCFILPNRKLARRDAY